MQKPTKLKKEMKKLGVEITSIKKCGSNHLKCFLTNGRFIIASATASDRRAFKNLKSDAVRELKWKPQN